MRAFGSGVIGTLLVLLVAGVAMWLALVAGADYEGALLVVIVLVLVAIVAGYFTASSSSVIGFLARWRQEMRLLFPPAADDNDPVVRDVRRTRDAFLTIAAAGLLGIFIYSLQWKPVGFARIFGSAVITAIASMTVGIGIGFLFGIPRTLQGDNPAPAAASPNAPAATRFGVNTNLEQISDWLTKIIVGLGLTHLTKIPEYVDRLSKVLSPSLNRDPAFALAIVVGYGACGALMSYLLTRLYLTGALVRAVVRAEQITREVTQVLNTVARDAAANPQAGIQGPEVEPASSLEVEAAHKLQDLAQSTDTEQLREQVNALAKEYENIRVTMPSGFQRTRAMEVVASKMRAMSLACYQFLPWLTTSPSPGHRLAAVSFLEVKASRDYLAWLEQRLAIEKPFIGYHAAQALRQAARELPIEDLPLVKTAMENALKPLGDEKHESDRANTLRAGLEELRKRTGTQLSGG